MPGDKESGVDMQFYDFEHSVFQKHSSIVCGKARYRKRSWTGQ